MSDSNTDKYRYKKYIIEKKYNTDISNNSNELKNTLDLIHQTLISLRMESASSPAPSASLSAAKASLYAARTSLSAVRRASLSASGRASSPAPRASLSAARASSSKSSSAATAEAEAEARAARIKERRAESNKKLPPYEDYSPPRTRQFTPAGPPPSPFSRRRTGLSMDSEGNVSGPRSRGDVRGHISRRKFSLRPGS